VTVDTLNRRFGRRVGLRIENRLSKALCNTFQGAVLLHEGEVVQTGAYLVSGPAVMNRRWYDMWRRLTTGNAKSMNVAF
jgi:hypothetical protein